MCLLVQYLGTVDDEWDHRWVRRANYMFRETGSVPSSVIPPVVARLLRIVSGRDRTTLDKAEVARTPLCWLEYSICIRMSFTCWSEKRAARHR